MQHIMFDILRRGWYVIVPAFVVSAVLNATGFSRFAAFLYIVGPIILKLDRENRTSTALQTLPIPSATIAKIYWFIGVVLFSLLNFVWLPALAVLTNSPRMDAWPHGLIAFIGMGYASLMVLVVAQLPRTPGETTLLNELFGAAWIALLCSGFFLQPFLATGYEENSPWFYVVVAASPAFIVLAYLRAKTLTRNPPLKVNGPKRGWPILNFYKGPVWFQIMAKAAGIGLVCALISIPVIIVVAQSPYARDRPELIPFSCWILAFTFGCFGMVWTTSIRTLRILPMSSVQLTSALVAQQFVALLTATVVIGLALPRLNEPHTSWDAATFLALGIALNLSMNALSLRFGARIAVPFISTLSMLFILIIYPTPFSVPIGLLISCGAFYMTKHSLETSGAVYRQKPPGRDFI